MENYYILHKNDNNNIVYSCFCSFDDYIKEVNHHKISDKFYKCVSYTDLLSLVPMFSLAWELSDDSVIINMAKARDIHRAILRQERAPRIAALDIAYMRALERGDTTAAQEIAAQKQILRDIPAHPAIEAAQTPEELQALTLDSLLALP
jgi:hypothetical protein